MRNLRVYRIARAAIVIPGERVIANTLTAVLMPHLTVKAS
jgi:hypothetical protein